ncbi:MAG TPA: LysM peptidoglycan-binding domain-containing protein [Dokdonella sp.]|uniref:LysM peptidoglycan-binding domain-containing protein n=1 Tax=Dokdonella sp. TaxID=2291710 RepID=UPI0025C28D4F|nr:LysM peptidoglycan-binding domain-containing protein [Dokdonella sp.]MBX3691618.1 LysM peptidoglycan-binding domain-containing protein [Dokdonella sp.]HNR90872.1 LysM peptidoglycan-binding domain-containing protein [Dokdonella sp.]
MSQVQSVSNGTTALAASGPQFAGYTVERGDTLSSIAREHGVSLSDLIAANPQINNPNVIYPGQHVNIPAGSRGAEPAPTAPGGSAPGGSFDYSRITGVAGNPNVTPQFLREVEAMAARLGTKPEYILATMSFETGGTFSPSIKNPTSSATGLIQFLDSTARGLGTSTAELARMSPVEQLKYVEKYFAPFAGRLGTLEAVYTAVLSGSPKPDPNTTLFSAGSNAYNANRGLDLNGDGRITAGEATSKVRARISGSLDNTPAPAPQPGNGGGTGAPAPAAGDYTVHRGDTLSGIAQRHGVSLSSLIAANPQIANPNLIYPGQHIHLPGSASSAPASTHTVQRGDTLSGIAQQHGVSLSSLIAANPQITNPNLIHPGQQIHLPGSASSAPASTHTVQRGDTLSGIAQQHGVSLSSLIAANPQIANPNLIHPGQEVRIPGGVTSGGGRVDGPSPTSPTTPVSGNNPARIAERFLDRNASELKRSGDLPMNPNVPSNLCCANFVSAVLEKAGLISHGQRSDSVAQLNTNLRNAGWTPVSLANARPGDVVIIQGGGMSHTEIVASNDNGKVTFIGSNNRNADGTQRITYDNGRWFTSTSHYTILTPPR